MTIVAEHPVNILAKEFPGTAPSHLGLHRFSTSTKPSFHQTTFAGALSALLIAAGILCSPYASTPLLPIPGFMTAFGTGMLVINILLAALLLSKGAIERRGDVVRLGAAYLFVAAVYVPLTLSFKDGFVPGTLIGTPATSVWLWSFWHFGFALAISWYAINVGRTQAAPSVLVVCLAITTVVSGVSLVTTVGIDTLPALLWNGTTFFSGWLNCIPVGLIGLNGLALLLCFRLRARTTEQLWLTVAMMAACFDLWLTAHGGSRFALGWYLSKCGSFTTSLVVLMSLFHDITKLYRQSALANRELEKLTHRDGLTGIFNRRHFDEAMDREWTRAKRSQMSLSLAMVDVDFFKQFNDLYGHVAGDDGLRNVSRALKEAVHRSSDVVARFGGEEFAILLPNTDHAGALKVAETLRAAVERLAIPHQGNSHGHLTVSIGVATLVPDPEMDPQLLIKTADAALYRSKSQGRNRVFGSDAPDLPIASNMMQFEKSGSSAVAGASAPRPKYLSSL